MKSAGHRDPIAARGRDIAHRHDHRDVLGLGRDQRLADAFRRHDRAAGAVDPHDQRLDAVIDRACDFVGDGVAAGNPGTRLAIDDGPCNGDDADRTSAGAGADIANECGQGDAPERVVARPFAAERGEPLLERLALADLVDQPRR